MTATTDPVPTPVRTEPRLLVVDDELIVAQRICSIFEECGYETEFALSGRECMEALECGAGFDAVILDIDLGIREPHGGAVADGIRARFNVPIVFYTGHTDRATIGLTQKSDSFGIVAKAPGDKEILIAAVATAIRRWQSEQQISAESDSYRIVLELLPLPLVVLEAKTGQIRLANDSAARFFTGEARCYGDAFVMPEPGEEPFHIDDGIDNGRSWTIVGPLSDRLQGRKWLVASRDLPTGETIRAHHDVTALFRRVRSLEREVTAAEALLHDVHHRVKNNLAIVDALIGMTQQQLERPDVLDTVRAQVRTVQTLHDRLHVSQQHSDVEIVEYLEHVARASLAMGMLPRLEVGSDTGLTMVPGRVALPLGLIVAELITNAQKHSFEPDSSNWIRVTMNRPEPSAMELIVEFNGASLPPDDALAQSAGSGVRLIRGLVRQLEGSITFERCPHNCVHIRFSCPDPELN